MGMDKRTGGKNTMSSVMSLFDAFLVMIVCIILAGIMLIAFTTPADYINTTLNASSTYSSVPTSWKNDSMKELLLVSSRLISVLLIIIGVGNFFLTAVRRQEVQDVNSYQYQWNGGRQW